MDKNISYDSAYKMLFNFPQMVESFLNTVLPKNLIDRFDLASLEKAFTEHTAPNAEGKPSTIRNDCVWRLRFTDGHPCYLYFMCEFQSRNDNTMPYRIAQYTSELMIELYNSGMIADGDVPMILPVVLYNGATKWTAQTDLSLLFSEDDPLLKYQLRQAYLLVDERHTNLQQYGNDVQLSTLLFRLEQSITPEELKAAAGDLDRLLQSEAFNEFRSVWITFIQYTILPRYGVKHNNQDTITLWRDLMTFIDGTVPTAREYAFNQGFSEGRESGFSEGRSEGQAIVLFNIMMGNKWTPEKVVDFACIPQAEQQDFIITLRAMSNKKQKNDNDILLGVGLSPPAPLALIGK